MYSLRTRWHSLVVDGLLSRLHVLFKPTPSRLLDNSKPPRNCKADIRQPKEEYKGYYEGYVWDPENPLRAFTFGTCKDPDCYMGRVRPRNMPYTPGGPEPKEVTDKNMDDDPSLGCCCCHCWCHKMGDWCKLPNNFWTGYPNLDSKAVLGSECPLGSVLSSAQWDPSGLGGDSVREFKCTECEKGTYKDVTGRYDSLIVCPPGSPPASDREESARMGLRYVH